MPQNLQSRVTHLSPPGFLTSQRACSISFLNTQLEFDWTHQNQALSFTNNPSSERTTSSYNDRQYSCIQKLNLRTRDLIV